MEKKTCLYDQHVALGAQMSPFGGFIMPIQYSDITTEHLAVRTKLGVFDVSHMGEVVVTGAEAEAFVNYIFTNDVRSMAYGNIQYGMMLHPSGGVVDDLLVYKFTTEHYLLVINAANIDKDVEHITAQAAGFDVKVENVSDSYGQIALQGPDAEKIATEVLGLDVEGLVFYNFREVAECLVSRTGYTGEDGFEIYATPEKTVEYWYKLIEAGVQPCGLGCRDTLRFEAGLPLYGHELNDETTPIEAGLGMFVKAADKEKMLGKDVILDQKASGVSKKLVGLEIDTKAPCRAGSEVYSGDQKVGEVTTGYVSISLGKSLAFAYVDAAVAALDTALSVHVRRKEFPCSVVKKRFYLPNYKK